MRGLLHDHADVEAIIGDGSDAGEEGQESEE
jgi:hypothetical protein